MALKWTSLLLLQVVLVSDFMVQIAVGAKNQPNIVIIMADDMGFDDVSFHGSNEFLTPNIDALAFSGVILNRYYVPAMCTPSRSSLMTGKNPINIGMQHYVIPNDQPWGLPLKEKTLAQYFKEAGYFTSLIGKWHLGFSKKLYTPLYRGFDHHYGYYGGYVDYYDQTLCCTNANYSRGHDFRNNLNVTKDNQGKYVTDSLTEEAERLIKYHNTEMPLLMILSHLAPHSGNPDKPFQAPAEEIEKFKYIKNPNRRIYAAMVSKLDESIGKVVEALNAKGILNNTILLFYSDNGAPVVGLHSNEGSNHPFRGQKNSPWEGGIRSSAAIWSPLIQNGGSGRIWNQTMHVSDWLPTLASAAGIKLNDNLHLDGFDLWNNLTKGSDPVPRRLVHNIDDIFKYVSYSKDKWKYINGTTLSGTYDGWLKSRKNDHTDPRSHHYEDVIKESITWKTLVQYKKTDQIDDIFELRQKASITCSKHKEVSKCEPLQDECIFNLAKDPCEQNNLISELRNSKLLREIRTEVEEFRRKAVPPVVKPTDPKCDPKFYDFEWTWWEDL